MKQAAAAVSAWLRTRLPAMVTLPLLWLAAAACAGIWLADALPSWSAFAWLGIVAAAAVLTAVRPGFRTLLPLCAAVFAFAHVAADRDPLRDALAGIAREGGAASATVTGLVADAPEPEPSGDGFRFPITVERVESLTLEGDFAGSRLYARLRGFPPGVRYGDRITVTGLVRRAESPRNPGEFDYPLFLRRQGYSAEFEASFATDHLTTLARDQGSLVMAAALRARDWIGETVTANITEDASLAATVRTMVLGTREKIPDEVEEAFIASGTMHVFAVSGLHVMLFFGILWTVLRTLRLPHGWIIAVALPLVFFYVFITGLRPSAWRAAVMAAIMAGASSFNRESSPLNGLGAAALLLLGWDTRQLFQPGFTLSFGVLLTIAWLHPPLQRWLRPLREADPFLPHELYSGWLRFRLWLSRPVVNSLSISAAAMLGSTLLMVYYFGIVTPVSVVANLFLVALSSAILAVACASLAVAAAGLLPLTFWLNKCNGLLALASVRTAQFFAAMPGGHFYVNPSRLWRGEVCEVTVLHLDSGGGAVHIDTPGGRHWLVDTGGRRHFARTLRPHLTRSPVNCLHGLVLSHQDTHHTGAAGEVRRLFAPETEPALTAGDRLTLDEGVELHCLFPPAGWKAGLADDRCAVFMLHCRGTRILIVNDAGFLTEKALLAAGTDLRADVLVKGRHRTDYSGLPEFLNAVRPRAAVFTNSPFPAGETVDSQWTALLGRKGIRPFDQARTGAVTITIRKDGMELRGYCEDGPSAGPGP